jgi:magnesium transporter
MNSKLRVRLAIDANGVRHDVGTEAELRTLLATRASLIWLDVDRDELHLLDPYRDLIHLHPLALEDAASPRQRPIFNRYRDTFFLVLYELVTADVAPFRVHTYPISFFVGQNYVITARDAERSTLDDVADRWLSFTEDVGSRDSGFLVYALIDAMVDNYFPAMDSIGDRLEAIEDIVEEGNGRHVQSAIREMRKELFEIRRVLAPGREVITELIRRDTPLVTDETMNYFHDVYDHILRSLDTLEAYREMGSTLFEMQMTMSSHQLDRVMRTLTVWSIILMAVTLIASIYGMNFIHMPERYWRFGYPFALVLMLGITTGLLVVFRRRRWI